MKIVPATEAGIGEAAGAIRAGLVVAYPTETVYGLAVNPFAEEAVLRLFAIKARDVANPILLIVANEEQLREVVKTISPSALVCMRAFWPGPLSLLFEKSSRMSSVLTGGHDKIGVRQTSCNIAHDLCLAAGHALTSTSANRAGLPPALSPADIDLEGIAVVIDGGVLEPSPPSTVFDPGTGKVLRQGAIPEKTLREALGGRMKAEG